MAGALATRIMRINFEAYDVAMATVDQLLRILSAVAGPSGGENLTRFSHGGDIFLDGVVDSLTVLEYISQVESHFLVEFNVNEITAENFSSLPALAALVESKIFKS